LNDVGLELEVLSLEVHPKKLAQKDLDLDFGRSN